MSNPPIDPVFTDSSQYQTVAASTTQVCGPGGGGVGDYLAGITIQPGTTTPGSVVIKDGSTTVYTFPGGASSVADLRPFPVLIGANSLNGGWSIVTGTNVTVLGRGRFT